MYIYLYIYMYKYIYAHTHTHIPIHTHTHTLTHMHTHTYRRRQLTVISRQHQPVASSLHNRNNSPDLCALCDLVNQNGAKRPETL